MSKIHLPHRPVTLNIVFAVCLLGSILFAAASEYKACKDGSCEVTSLLPKKTAAPLPSSAG